MFLMLAFLSHLESTKIKESFRSYKAANQRHIIITFTFFRFFSAQRKQADSFPSSLGLGNSSFKKLIVCLWSLVSSGSSKG